MAKEKSKLKPCKHCGVEIAKGVKKCPSCGGKLKMGKMLKLIILIAGIAVVAGITAPSLMEKKDALEVLLTEMTTATPSSLSPTGELSDMFSMMSDHTDLQRDNKEKEIIGKIVDWTLPVYEVNKKSDDRGDKYRIQTSGGSYVGTFVDLWSRSGSEKSRIEALKTGDLIRIKGRISGTWMRNISIDDAVLMK